MRNRHWSRLARRVLACSASASIFVAACGGTTDEDASPDASVTAGGTSRSGGTGGTAGTPSGGGAPPIDGGGDAGAAGEAGAYGPPSQCGTTTCPGLPLFTPWDPQACCLGETGETCGATLSFFNGQCVELNQPGTPDPKCPEREIEGVTFQGCCRPDGYCGVVDDLIGFGCPNPAGLPGIDATCCVAPDGPGCFTCKQVMMVSDCALPSLACGWDPNNPGPVGATKSAAKFFEVIKCMCDPGNCESACPEVCNLQNFPEPTCEQCYLEKCVDEMAVCNADDGT